MKRNGKDRRRTDPLERAIEAALAPGCFVSYRLGFDFVRDLEELEAQLRRMVSSEPTRAIIMYETFLAGCCAKAEEVDDSGGSFGGFVGELFCGWVKARQAAHADPGETAARLVAWMDDDPYGFASDLDREAIAVLDKAGRAAFVREARSRFDTGAAMAAPAGGKGAQWRTPEVERRVWGRRLRRLYLAQKQAIPRHTSVRPWCFRRAGRAGSESWAGTQR